MQIFEGGNMFPDVEPFDQKDVPAILNIVNKALNGTGIRVIPVGSGASPTPGKISGDLDVMADEDQVLQFFNAKDAKSARKELNAYIAKQGLGTAQSGINVHVRAPLGDKAHQVDIMVSPKADRVSKFHTHDIPAGSPYKGVNKQLMMALLAKSKGYMWSAWQGLFARNEEGKKGDFVSDDLDEIAQLLIGSEASGRSLSSVEAILKSLPSNEAEQLLDRARQDPNWKERPVNEELARIKKLSGLKDEDVSIGGLTKHDNGDVSYNAGPLSMRKKADGSSDSSYTMGDTTARVQQNPIGVKTLTAKGSAADDIVGVDASAARKGVDPAKFAAFQKQQAKEELDAMLRIARLR